LPSKSTVSLRHSPVEVLRHHWADGGLRIGRVADLERGHGVLDRPLHLAETALRDEEPSPRGACLTAVHEGEDEGGWDGSPGRTVAAWIEPLESMNDFGVVSWGSGDCTAHQFGLGTWNDTNTDATTALIWEGCNDFFSSLTVAANKWSFMALVFAASQPHDYSLYVNGQVSAVQLSAVPATQSGPIVMGHNDSASGTPFFRGALDSARIYGRALSAAEISGLYMSP